MGEVATINTNVKRTVDDVCTWLEAKAERGELPASSARLKCTALRQLITPLGSSEPNDIEWVLAHIEELTKRWATLNSQYKSDTATTYLSRGKTALEDYLRWQDDPTSFRFREPRPRAEKPQTSGTGESRRSAAGGVPPQDPPVPDEATLSNRFRMGPGREFHFKMPDDVSVSEIRRIAMHLLTYAQDWDPTTPTESFAIVRTPPQP